MKRKITDFNRGSQLIAHFAQMFAAGFKRIIMVDTGIIADLAAVHQALVEASCRDSVHLAFGGGVRLDDLAGLRAAGADAVDIGRAILDAPLLDLDIALQLLARPVLIISRLGLLLSGAAQLPLLQP